jgi:hypothetical protein
MIENMIIAQNSYIEISEKRISTSFFDTFSLFGKSPLRLSYDACMTRACRRKKGSEKKKGIKNQ